VVVFSEFADKLRCQHCGKTNKAADWPAQGDMVPFYYQKEPGKYYVTVRCPECAKDWYVVWDDDPGPGCQTGAKAPADEFSLPVEESATLEELPRIDDSAEAAPAEAPSEALEEEVESEEPEKEGLLAKLSRANPYAVLLGVSLAAILIAILFLFMEMMIYDFDIKARQGKEGALLTPASQSAPASTTAAA